MKRFLAILLALTMALCFSACKKKETAEMVQEKKWLELTIATNLSTDHLRLVSQEGMMADLGIKVTLIALGADAAADLENRFAGGERFDLLLVQGVSLQKMMLWKEQGYIQSVPTATWQPMNSLYAHSVNWQTAFGSEEGMLGIPQSAWDKESGNSNMMLFCRSDWAHVLGVDDLDVVTWEKFMRLLEGFSHTDPNDDDVSDTWGITWCGESFFDYMEAMMGVGPWLLDSGRVVPGYSSRLAQDAAMWLVQMSRGGLLDRNAVEQTAQEALSTFCHGKAGMLLWDDVESLETAWKDAQDDLDTSVPIGSVVKVMALPENPYGVKHISGTEDAVMLFSAELEEENIERVLNWMEAISRLLWLTPNSPTDEASFAEICAYRQQIFYRPYQDNAPDFTLAMTNYDMATLNAAHHASGRNVLLCLLENSEPFEATWGVWQQEDRADNDLIMAVNSFALSRKLFPEE